MREAARVHGVMVGLKQRYWRMGIWDPKEACGYCGSNMHLWTLD